MRCRSRTCDVDGWFCWNASLPAFLLSNQPRVYGVPWETSRDFDRRCWQFLSAAAENSRQRFTRTARPRRTRNYFLIRHGATGCQQTQHIRVTVHNVLLRLPCPLLSATPESLGVQPTLPGIV